MPLRLNLADQQRRSVHDSEMIGVANCHHWPACEPLRLMIDQAIVQQVDRITTNALLGKQDAIQPLWRPVGPSGDLAANPT